MQNLKWLARAWSSLALLCLCLPLLFGGLELGTSRLWQRALGNTRNPLLALAAISLIFLASPTLRDKVKLFFKDPAKVLNEKRERQIVLILASLYFLIFLKISWFRYFAFEVNAIDFSIYDFLIPRTSQGQFMQSPACGDCDHFGVHSNLIFFLLYPLHRFFDHPLFLVTLHPLVLWSGFIPLYSLARHYLEASLHRVILVAAFFNLTPLAWVLASDFHPEAFYIPFILSIAACAARNRIGWAGFFTFLTLLVKEDAAFYLAPAAFACLLNSRQKLIPRRWAAAGLAAALISYFICSRWIIPSNQIGTTYSNLRFWSHYGDTAPAIALGFLQQPITVLTDVLKGGSIPILSTFLFMPLLNPFTLGPILVFMLIQSTADSSQLRSAALYYSAPLIPFLWMGSIGVLRRIQTRKLASPILLALLILTSLTGHGYIAFARPDWDKINQLKKIQLPLEARICVQASLLPHIGYPRQVQLLSNQCLTDGTELLLANPSLPLYPLTSQEISRLLSQFEQDARYSSDHYGDFVLYKKR